MKKYIPLAFIIGLMLITITAVMLSKNSATVTVGGAGQRWSYNTTTASSTSVIATATLLSATSTTNSRIYARYTNASTTAVLYVCPFKDACTTSNGIPIKSEDFYAINDEKPYQGPVYAVTAGGTSTVSIYTMQ